MGWFLGGERIGRSRRGRRSPWENQGPDVSAEWMEERGGEGETPRKWLDWTG